MTNATQLAAGNLVRLVKPVDADEAAARYEVAEVRGDRVLIRLVCDLPIRPTEAVMVSDVTLAGE